MIKKGYFWLKMISLSKVQVRGQSSCDHFHHIPTNPSRHDPNGTFIKQEMVKNKKRRSQNQERRFDLLAGPYGSSHQAK
jgi:hypothetical protein